MSRYCILVAKVCQEGLLWRSMTQLTRPAARRVIRTGTVLTPFCFHCADLASNSIRRGKRVCCGYSSMSM
jgi:hypothetical protein